MLGGDFAPLLSAAQGGDEEAFARLWNDANPALLRYLRVVSSGDPEDVAAETWATVARGLRRFQGGETDWRAWLFTTARRRAVDDGRVRARHPSVPVADFEEGHDGHGAGADPELLVLHQLDVEAAVAAMRRLPAMQAEVVMLRVVAGLPAATVAAMTGSTPGAVRVAAHRGLRRLALLLAEAGVTP